MLAMKTQFDDDYVNARRHVREAGDKRLSYYSRDGCANSIVYNESYLLITGTVLISFEW